FQAEDGIRDFHVTGVQTCALPICREVPGVARGGLRHGRDDRGRGRLERLRAAARRRERCPAATVGAGAGTATTCAAPRRQTADCPAYCGAERKSRPTGSATSNRAPASATFTVTSGWRDATSNCSTRAPSRGTPTVTSASSTNGLSP